ncbi:unnamed protein product [Vitrella brassicaformis CCMP3155]|uniref:Uncharacterized protein n=1 Tax=Vitrella brassicaformis (strain CCMP3155) TaxID=1169540 RepID=A0A0G4F693_VITBC|nr:unnamed protein product [Vitrella brassicaformis CCMP3155]|mmetsp:Transcript_34054/g.84204  ORF Transcript_34054/g.84204 Transcript_34054/m.84204 type:complete len:467 (-) Transcript_34054:237-1637(-)|eukprot:CEM07764.1 unnamed protein product [Vitrella brassicaformis CCMP3155]
MGERQSFSWFEYQLLTLSLAVFMCFCLGVLEYVLRRFSILPLMFTMLTIQRRRMYCFEVDISLTQEGKHIRQQCKMMLRITLIVVLSYVWQGCVLESVTITGGSFPTEECEQDKDCFAATLSFDTLFQQSHKSIDCDKPEEYDSEKYIVVNCLSFVNPNAVLWMEKAAIAYSLGLLLLRAFEILLWVCSRSLAWMRIVLFVLITYTIALIVLFFAGYMATFVSSWLAYVMMFSFPGVLLFTQRAARCLRELRRQLYAQYQQEATKSLQSQFSPDEEMIQAQDIDQAFSVKSVTPSEPQEAPIDDATLSLPAASAARHTVSGYDTVALSRTSPAPHHSTHTHNRVPPPHATHTHIDDVLESLALGGGDPDQRPMTTSMTEADDRPHPQHGGATWTPGGRWWGWARSSPFQQQHHRHSRGIPIPSLLGFFPTRRRAGEDGAGEDGADGLGEPRSSVSAPPADMERAAA